MSRLTSIDEENEENVENVVSHLTSTYIDEENEEDVLEKVVPVVSVTFNILVWDQKHLSTLTGKINSFRYEEESGEMDLQIEKLVLKNFEFLCDDDKYKGLVKLTLDNICIGILAVSPIYSTCGLFKCDTSYKETRAFDFYYDSFMGSGYFKGERIVIQGR